MAANKLSMNDVPAGSDWWVPTLALAGGIALMQGAVMALRIRKAVALSHSIEPLQADVGRALQLTSDRADAVVLMPVGNVGNAPFFTRPLSWLMRRRSLRLHALARGAAGKANAIYVNNYKKRHEDLFVRDARRLNAADGLHPSDDGYRLWFSALQEQAALSERLAALAAS